MSCGVRRGDWAHLDRVCSVRCSSRCHIGPDSMRGGRFQDKAISPPLVVHSNGIPAESVGSGTKGTGRNGMVPEQAPECAIILT